MNTRIKQLNCKVTVTTGKRQPAFHAQEKPERPAMAFVLTKPEPEPEAGRTPAKTATEASEDAGREATAAPAKADPRAVAERVYDLMREEVLIGRLRGGSN